MEYYLAIANIRFIILLYNVILSIVYHDKQSNNTFIKKK